MQAVSSLITFAVSLILGYVLWNSGLPEYLLSLYNLGASIGITFALNLIIVAVCWIPHYKIFGE